MENYRINIQRDAQEDLNGQKKIDSMIFKMFLLMIVIIPLIVSAGLDVFQSPIIESEPTFVSGYKGDVFALHKSLIAIFSTIILLVLFLYKILFLNYKIQHRVIHWFLLALGVFILISTSFAPYKTLALFGMPSRYDGAIMYLSYLFLFFLALEINYPKNAFQYISYSLIPFVVINFVFSLMSFWGNDPLSYGFIKKITTLFLPKGASIGQGSTLIGTLNQGNYMSGSFGVMTILFLIISIGENSVFKKILFLLLSTLSGATMLMSLAQSGFVTLTSMSLLILFILVKTKHPLKSMVVLLGFVVIFASMITVLSNKNPKVWSESVGFFTHVNPFEVQKAAADTLTKVLLGSKVEASDNPNFTLPNLPASGIGPGSGRLFIWNRTLDLVMERPFIGYGFDTLPFFFPQNDPEKHAQIETYKVTVDKPHSMYVGMLYSTGIFGFIAFAGILFLSVFYFIRMLWKSKLQDINIKYLAAFGVAWVAYLFQSLFNDTVVGTSIHMWIIGGIVTVFSIRFYKTNKLA